MATRTIINFIHHLTVHPRRLFLVDSLGALLTTFFLFVVLRTFHQFIGMPVSVLTYLSVFGICFCMYSALCYLFLNRNWVPFIQIIAIANLIYCVSTMVLVLIHFSQLTALGIAYFLGEIAIVSVLVYIELSVANKIKQKRTGENL